MPVLAAAGAGLLGSVVSLVVLAVGETGGAWPSVIGGAGAVSAVSALAYVLKKTLDGTLVVRDTAVREAAYEATTITLARLVDASHKREDTLTRLIRTGSSRNAPAPATRGRSPR